MYVGNDVISFQSAALKSKHFLTQRYLDKLFTASEQVDLTLASDKVEAFCLLWAAKEAAYKVYNKQSGNRMYHPKKFEVKLRQDYFHVGLKKNREEQGSCLGSNTDHSSFIGTVTTPLCELKVLLQVTSNWVHSVVAEQPKAIHKVNQGVEEILSEKYSAQSSSARKLLIAAIAAKTKTDPSCYSIKKQRVGGKVGSPHLFYNGQKSEISISMSHDEKYVAYAFL